MFYLSASAFLPINDSSCIPDKTMRNETYFRTVNLKFKFRNICVCLGGLPSRLNINEIFKIVIQFKKLDENIQRNWDESSSRKEYI